MPVPVTAVYLGINALILLYLAYRVTRERWRVGIGLGDGGDTGLARTIRVHANNAEHVPLALLMIGALELMAAPLWLLHGLGVALTLGRVAHAYGLGRSSGPSPGSIAGTCVTWLVYLAGALGCLYYGLLA
jgi:uncharacterized membrane protein YecN with MAPEG domain